MTPSDFSVVLAIDPGKTCGLAEFSFDYRKTWVGYQFRRYDVIDHIEKIMDWTWKDVIKGRILVVTEKYIITPKTSQLSQQPDALKINGALEWLCYKYGHVYEEQPQGTAKKMAKDWRLRELNFFVPGRDHANDAARHLILALERHRPSVFEPGGILGYNQNSEIERMG